MLKYDFRINREKENKFTHDYTTKLCNKHIFVSKFIDANREYFVWELSFFSVGIINYLTKQLKEERFFFFLTHNSRFQSILSGK